MVSLEVLLANLGKYVLRCCFYSYSFKVAWIKSQNAETVCYHVKKSMSQGQGTHCCLLRRQSEWWLAAYTLGASSVVWLPCSRIRLALKAGSPLLLVYLEGLRVQGWWTRANLTRNRGLNQNVHLLFSNKSCTFQVHWDLPARALPSLRAHLWGSQMVVGQLISERGLHEGSWLMISLSDGLQPCAWCIRLDWGEGSSVYHTNSVTYDRVQATLPNDVCPDFAVM